MSTAAARPEGSSARGSSSGMTHAPPTKRTVPLSTSWRASSVAKSGLPPVVFSKRSARRSTFGTSPKRPTSSSLSSFAPRPARSITFEASRTRSSAAFARTSSFVRCANTVRMGRFLFSRRSAAKTAHEASSQRWMSSTTSTSGFFAAIASSQSSSARCTRMRSSPGSTGTPRALTGPISSASPGSGDGQRIGERARDLARELRRRDEDRLRELLEHAVRTARADFAVGAHHETAGELCLELRFAEQATLARARLAGQHDAAAPALRAAQHAPSYRDDLALPTHHRDAREVAADHRVLLERRHLVERRQAVDELRGARGARERIGGEQREHELVEPRGQRETEARQGRRQRRERELRIGSAAHVVRRAPREEQVRKHAERVEIRAAVDG